MEVEDGTCMGMEVLIRLHLRLHRLGPSLYDPSPAATPSPATSAASKPFWAGTTTVLVYLFRGATAELWVLLTKLFAYL